MKSYIEVIQANQHLTVQEMESASQYLFDERTDPAVIQSFLTALAAKGETADEITALASVMARHAIRPRFTDESYIDNCGTGGDMASSFNISTAAAFVLAASGVKVAKHGNRKISSSSGSQDVLEELGIRNDLSMKETEEMMRQTGIAFLFAAEVHPKMKRIGEIRKQIKGPTIFNLVGPLTNPIPLQAQYTGINRQDFVMEYASVLSRLGRKRAIVVSGAGGLDEATLAGRNTLVLADNGDLIPFTLTPEDVGLAAAELDTIRGGDAAHNAAIMHTVFEGVRGPQFDTVVLNAGIGLFAEGAAKTIQEGVRLAEDTVLSGKAKGKLTEAVEFCRRHLKEAMI